MNATATWHVPAGLELIVGMRTAISRGMAKEPKTTPSVCLSTLRGEPSEADMLLMCLPFVIYSASMQMFLDTLTPAQVRVREPRRDKDQ